MMFVVSGCRHWLDYSLEIGNTLLLLVEDKEMHLLDKNVKLPDGDEPPSHNADY